MYFAHFIYYVFTLKRDETETWNKQNEINLCNGTLWGFAILYVHIFITIYKDKSANSSVPISIFL